VRRPGTGQIAPATAHLDDAPHHPVEQPLHLDEWHVGKTLGYWKDFANPDSQKAVARNAFAWFVVEKTGDFRLSRGIGKFL